MTSPCYARTRWISFRRSGHAADPVHGRSTAAVAARGGQVAPGRGVHRSSRLRVPRRPQAPPWSECEQLIIKLTLSWRLAGWHTGSVQEDFSWAGKALESDAEFNRTLGVQAVLVNRDRAVFRLPDKQHLHNHVGGPHAAALFGLGETAAACVTYTVFADLLEEHVPLIGGAEIRYARLLRGTATAEAVFAGDEQLARVQIADSGRATFPVQVTFRDADEHQTGEMIATMALRRKR
jgi:acyl-coenzyme A thioesterase PaaI-like protein